MKAESAEYATEPSLKLLTTLERLLAIQATAVKPALDEAATLVAAAVGAEKADAFLQDPTEQTLIAIGTSATPLGDRQRALGLDRLPMANGGRAVEVFRTGQIHQDGHVDEDTEELRGIREALHIRSSLIIPLYVGDTRRGVLQVSSIRPDAFSPEDRIFLEAVTRWVGMLIQRAELIERVAREASEQARRLVAEELVTILAHDLGNYLTPLVSRVHVLRTRAERDGRTADAAEAGALADSMRHLQRFIADLLDVARIEHGLFTMVPQPVNLAALAQEVAAAVQTPQFEVTVDTPEEVIAQVDPDRIRQALENLLANARRHAAGSPATVRVERAMPERVVLSIEDRGPGIAPEVLPNLAQRFVRGKGAKGLGIGLYLARSIAEAHGGALEVESAVGQGATFRLALPALSGEHRTAG